jgi:creatinine amidohydrolase/Fe(II)-dependent formamide hydrolase-like protein
MSRAQADAERPDLSSEVRTFTAFAERRRERASGVHGDPSVATAAKGERLFLAARDALLRVVQEVRELPVRRYHEFEQDLP